MHTNCLVQTPLPNPLYRTYKFALLLDHLLPNMHREAANVYP